MSVTLNSTASQALSQSSQRSEADHRRPDSESGLKFGFILAAILILAGAAYLSLAFNWPKFSRAEVFFAECVREMFQADNLVTPLYHGTPFFDKPILAYWFIAASYKLFGISHFAARIPSVVLALATTAMTAIAGRHLFGARQGLLAAAILASSLMFMSFANLCMSDMNLVFFDTLSLVLLYLSLLNEKHRSALLYVASLSMGLGFLTKGPVGIVLPAVSFIAYLSVTRQWNKIEIVKHVIPCSLILLGAGVPWFMAAFRQNGASALVYFFIHENLQRFAGSTYDTHRPVWFMVQSLVSGMLPWSIFIPFTLFDSFKSLWPRATAVVANEKEPAESGKRKQIFLLLWMAVVVGFFSLSRGKIDYYVLPAYPAAALLIANYLVKASDKLSKIVWFTSFAISGALLLAGLVSRFVLPRTFAHEGIANWQVIPTIVLACALPMLYFSCRGKVVKSIGALFVLICLMALSVSFQVYPWITSKQAVLKYIPYIRTLAQDDRVGVYTSLQNWIDEITYQTGCEPMKIETIKMAEQFLKSACPSVLLIQENEYKLMSAEAKKNCRIIGSNPFIPRSLNPMYFMRTGQQLGEASKLLLISNMGAQKAETDLWSEEP